MKLGNIFAVCLVASMALCGCVKSELDSNRNGDGVPEGYVRLEPNFILASEKVYLTRADNDIFTYIDDVHLLIFDGSGASVTLGPDGKPVSWVLNDDAPVTMREYYEYGVRQNIYLRKSDNYFVYALANLDDQYCPTGDVDSFLAQVETYGDLKNLYVQAINYSADDVGKMMMSTLDVIPVMLQYEDGGESDLFVSTIPMHRLRSQFVVTVYNKVASAESATIISGVYPSTLSFVDVPRYSYVVERPVDPVVGAHDRAYPLGADGYYESTTNLMPTPSGIEQITVRSAKTGQLQTNYYTKQQVTFYCLENRRGSVDPQMFENYRPEDTDVPNVYARKALAPDLSTYIRLTSLTDDEVLRTYVHAGKGRDVAANPDFSDPPGGTDDITNYDVDRSCIYYFNIYINGIEDVTVDSRRDYLDQVILINMSDDFNRLDAHHMDVPVYVEGRADGYIKMESGVGEDDSWRPMSELPEAERWLTFSWRDPYPGDGNVSTTLYARMNTLEAASGVMPILHLDEYVNTEPAGSYPAGVKDGALPASDPPRRNAVVRVGFVDGATSPDEYEQGVADNKESALYFEVSQYGLQTVGQVGGYADGYYQSLLGVESVEEYRQRFYLQGDNADVLNTGLPWRYVEGPGAGAAEGQYTFDGLGATVYRFNEYRNIYSGRTPPIRGGTNLAPASGLTGAVYNPYNTNAVDYCVRKNRDSNGNGVIDDAEIEWYMPTPVQMMQIYTWREAFRGGTWSLNQGYTPFSTTTRYYWTTVEEDAGTTDPNAYVLDFGQNVTMAVVLPFNKNTRYPVRCVRDIPGELDLSMIYPDEDGHAIINVTGNIPEDVIEDDKYGKSTNNYLNNPNHNTFGRVFIVARWYWYNGQWPSDTPNTVNNNGNMCVGYSEPGYTSGWVPPSQQELSLIYAYAGMLENLFAAQWPSGPGAATYHRFTTGDHWAVTSDGTGSTYWTVNFTTGASNLTRKQNQAFFRCIRYIDTSNGSEDSPDIPPRP